MRIRPYEPDRDFTKISHWINDERTHALWCAGRFPYPLSADSFHGVLSDMERNSGDKPFTAVDENGRAVGFFCCWIDRENSNAMLKFVVVDSSARGRGYGREMINLAARYAFDVETVDTVTLNVFSVNGPARKCYSSAGFKEISVTDNAFSFGGESWGRCFMRMENKLKEDIL
ncbi:GNAT family protein [uncultured Ruminococcus sp.]|uniref:GNAT family N-acetyltransferase n=1 Tax=uncultured Ruminococcus sp. TaxID=165186 RepID=UPI0025D7E56C|nr:GNAT family protein [uncultured Ruminococcus sp.]